MIKQAIQSIRKQQRGVGLPARMVAYGLIWLILSGGDPVSWYWGLPAIVIAALFNPFEASPAWRWRTLEALRFFPVFIALSLRSALDVGWRAAHPAMPLDPTLIHYRWQLPPGAPRIFFAVIINLMPGTLSFALNDDCMTVHVLADRKRAERNLRFLEARIACLYDVSLEGS